MKEEKSIIATFCIRASCREKTRDLGGLSFIGDGITNTIVKNNCVKNVIGFDTNPNGTILTPFFNWGIYLDNDASGFLVEGNVVNTNVNGGVFFHGGKDNMVRNNIFINCSNHFPKKGRYGYYDAGQSDVGTFLKHHSYLIDCAVDVMHPHNNT